MGARWWVSCCEAAAKMLFRAPFPRARNRCKYTRKPPFFGRFLGKLNMKIHFVFWYFRNAVVPKMAIFWRKTGRDNLGVNPNREIGAFQSGHFWARFWPRKKPATQGERIGNNKHFRAFPFYPLIGTSSRFSTNSSTRDRYRIESRAK